MGGEQQAAGGTLGWSSPVRGEVSAVCVGVKGWGGGRGDHRTSCGNRGDGLELLQEGRFRLDI